jgi:hypothetical protein
MTMVVVVTVVIMPAPIMSISITMAAIVVSADGRSDQATGHRTANCPTCIPLRCNRAAKQAKTNPEGNAPGLLVHCLCHAGPDDQRCHERKGYEARKHSVCFHVSSPL